jgi:hypothetical protein
VRIVASPSYIFYYFFNRIKTISVLPINKSNTLVITLPAIPLNFEFPPATFSPAIRPCLLLFPKEGICLYL